MVTNIGPQAMALIGVVAAIVQQIKRHPGMVKIQEKIPLYQISSIALGIGGAYLLGIANPIIVGVIVGLSASGAYDIVK